MRQRRSTRGCACDTGLRMCRRSGGPSSFSPFRQWKAPCHPTKRECGAPWGPRKWGAHQLSHTSLQPGTCAMHHHPLACAVLEEIHPNKLTAGIFSVPSPLFLDTGGGHGNIAVHLHVYRSIFKPPEFVMEGFEIG